MTSRSRPLLCAMVVFAAAVYPDIASACSCAGSSLPCGSLIGSSVFIGTVQAKSDAPPERIGNAALLTYAFELAVVEGFAGVSSPNVTVRTSTDTAACGYPFKVGESYLVYATPMSGGGYSVSLCSRTRRLADAHDDLVLLRQAVKGQRSSRVFGRVVREALQVNGRFSDTETVGPEPGVPVVARNGAFSVETTTDGDGRFVFVDLPPGRYQIEPRWPQGMKSRFPADPVTVGPCGAGDIFFWAVTDAPLGGTVRGLDGAPVGKNVAVTIIRMDPTDPRGARAPERSTLAFTDERGRYEFDGLPAGRYLVGVNVFDPPSTFSPYPGIYHPSGSDMASAVPVDVSEGRQVRIDLRLPPRLPTKRISGVVVDEHDVPVAGAFLTLADLEFPHSMFTVHATSDRAGHFELQVIEGRRYVIRAVSYQPERRAELTLPAGNGSGLRVVVRP